MSKPRKIKVCKPETLKVEPEPKTPDTKPATRLAPTTRLAPDTPAPEPIEAKASVVEPAVTGDPACEYQFKLHFEFEALVHSEEEAKQVGEMFATLGMVVKSTGVPARFTGGVYGKEAPAPSATPAPIDRSLN